VPGYKDTVNMWEKIASCKVHTQGKQDEVYTYCQIPGKLLNNKTEKLIHLVN
jgi:hypothetical protein